MKQLDPHYYSIKWNLMLQKKPDADCVPFTVADMEFSTAPEIKNALKEYIDNYTLGYTHVSDRYKDAVVQWFEHRHHIHFNPKHLIPTPGVIAALYNLIPVVTQPNDRILILTPVYGPFSRAIKDTGRTVCPSELINTNGVYSINWDDLSQKMSDPQCTALIFCNPHNPIGKVWSLEDLQMLHQLAQKYNVSVISDEIHCDLIMPKSVFTSYHAVNQEAIICTAASKSFNLAGLQTANIFVPNKETRGHFSKQLASKGIHAPNGLGLIATEAAYTQAEAWLDQHLHIIYENYLLLLTYLKKTPLVISPLEGTYLCWIDASQLNIDEKKLMTLFQEHSIFVNPGSAFDQKEGTFFRVNIACDPTYIKLLCTRILNIIDKL